MRPRTVILITLLALAWVGAGLVPGTDIESLAKNLPFAEDVTDRDAAVEARCGDLQSWMRRTCEDDLSERFASGHATPEAVLRLHCTRIETVWEQTLPEPPALCAARFGGWLSS